MAQKTKATLERYSSTRTLSWLERDLFPFLGNRPMESITSADMLTALHRIEQRGA